MEWHGISKYCIQSDCDNYRISKDATPLYSAWAKGHTIGAVFCSVSKFGLIQNKLKTADAAIAVCEKHKKEN